MKFSTKCLLRMVSKIKINFFYNYIYRNIIIFFHIIKLMNRKRRKKQEIINYHEKSSSEISDILMDESELSQISTKKRKLDDSKFTNLDSF